jgi:hypothetical protein
VMPVVHNGMILVIPLSTSITGAGSSATINSGGSVSFSSCATISLNGVFSSTFNNYIIDIRHKMVTGATNIAFRVRSSGVDESSGSNNYWVQNLTADGTTVSGGRGQSNTGQIGSSNDTANGQQVFIYGPFLSQPTTWRSIDAEGFSGAYILDRSNTHYLSSSYDGFSLILGSGAFGGLIKVYGLRQ